MDIITKLFLGNIVCCLTYFILMALYAEVNSTLGVRWEPTDTHATIVGAWLILSLVSFPAWGLYYLMGV